MEMLAEKGENWSWKLRLDDWICSKIFSNDLLAAMVGSPSEILSWSILLFVKCTHLLPQSILIHKYWCYRKKYVIFIAHIGINSKILPQLSSWTSIKISTGQWKVRPALVILYKDEIRCLKIGSYLLENPIQEQVLPQSCVPWIINI